MQVYESGDASGYQAASASVSNEAVSEPSSFGESGDFFPVNLFEISKPLFDLAMRSAFRVMHCSPSSHDAAKKDCDRAV